MRLPFAVLLTLAVSSITSGQTYTISTFAGGGLPANILGTSASLVFSPYPTGIAADAAGNVFFIDQNAVLRLDATTGILMQVAGNGTTGFSGDGGPATRAQLNVPQGVAVDSSGNLYIADTHNQRIRKVSNGTITTVAGNGTTAVSGDNGPATDATLVSPWGVAVDSAGNLYISDIGNHTIRKVANGVITTVAGNGTRGFSGDNGPAINAQLFSPVGIAVDLAGNLYIADEYNNRIRKVSNGTITTEAGNGISGFAGDNGPPASAELNSPTSVALDAKGNLYIADYGNQRIRKISSGVISTVAGTGQPGFSGDMGQPVAAQLNNPVGITFDSAGNLYIADQLNSRIRKISGGVIATVAGNGTVGFSGDDGPATNAQLSYPTSVVIDATGTLYIADSQNARVRMVSNGTIATVAGNGTLGFSGDNGPATNAQFELPEALAVDSSGNLYIADAGDDRVRKVSNGVITTVAGNGTDGFSGDNGPALSAQLSGPAGLAVDSAGNLYIADSSNNRIRRVANGLITTVAGNGTAGFSGDNGPATNAQLSGPAGLAVDSGGNLYIADAGNNRVRKISKGVITTVAGVAAAPGAKFELDDPVGVAVDSAGNLYIAEALSGLIDKVSNGVIAAVAGNRTPGFSGDGGPAIAAQLDIPQGLAVDSAGNVYIADEYNNRIRLLTPGGGGPYINVGGVLNAASSASGSRVAAGSIATVYGSLLTDYISTGSSTIPLPTSLGGLSLEFGGGLSAPLFFVSLGQVNFQVPWELAGQSQASLSAIVNGQTSATRTIALAPVAPGIFSMNGQGTGQGAILDGSYRLVDSSNPAIAGSTVIQIYCTGLGAVTNQPPSGSPPLSNQLSQTVATPTVTIGGVQAPVLFSGLAPGSVGEYQVDALVPTGSAKGAAVPVVIAFDDSVTANGVHISGAISNTVTIAVR